MFFLFKDSLVPLGFVGILASVKGSQLVQDSLRIVNDRGIDQHIRVEPTNL